MSKCIVSFGKNYNFERGIQRLKSQIENMVNVPFYGFTEYPEGCPTHEVSPFAFKFFCIQECIKKGHSEILWLDSSVVIKTDLQDVFDFIKKHGYFFIKNWHSVGQYCHDKALKTLQISREKSFNIPSLQGTNFGVNIKNDASKIFLEQLISLSTDGITFPGPYANDNNEASLHPQVSGHRHEQTAMSVVALRQGLNMWFPNEHKWFIHDRDYVKNIASTVVDINMCEQ
jgi:hypothetical protein